MSRAAARDRERRHRHGPGPEDVHPRGADLHGHHRHHGHEHDAKHPSEHGHGHSHGLIDPSIVRSRDGVKTVLISLLVLTGAAIAETVVFVVSGSVALLADLIHNYGDGLTALPLGAAFLLCSARGERWAGLGVVGAILVSAIVALYETVQRFIHPHQPIHLWILAAAGGIGFLGNEIAAQVRLRGGRRLESPALIADGIHARVDGFVSLGVVGSAVLVGLGLPIADPIIGLAITLVIVKITWEAWQTIYGHDAGR